MNTSITELLIGIVISSFVAFVAYKKESLTFSGLMAATLVGGFLYWWGGVILWITLISFFVSASIWTKVKHHVKKSINDIQVRGGRRDHVQVMANGIVPLVFSFIYFYFYHDDPYQIFLIAAVSAIAASNSDTWASELGVLSKGKTISILSWKVIDKGISGGISLFGTLIAAVGAFFIGFIYVSAQVIFYQADIISVIPVLLIISAAVFLGCLVDSLLGASVQAKYKEILSGKITEKAKDLEQTILAAGIRWVTNDIVNLGSAFSASLFVFLFRLG